MEKFIGDAAMAVFGIPVAHEDDALRAVRAVAEIRERLTALGDGAAVALSFRTGVNTGEVVAGGEGETLVTGDAVNVAARLEQAAARGRDPDRRRDARARARRGDGGGGRAARAEGEARAGAAFRLVAVDRDGRSLRAAPRRAARRTRSRAAAPAARVRGRRLGARLPPVHAARPGRGREVAAAGAPRASRARRADVLRSRCLHYGEDITYWPLVEILLAIGVEPTR